MQMTSASLNPPYAHLVLFSIMVAMVLGNCAAPQPTEPVVVQAPEPVVEPEDRHAELSETIAADPVGFLRHVAERTAQLEQYRLTFYRQERLGLPPRMGAMETIQASFRQEPFSVKFEWPSEDAPYYEAVYVEGQNKNQLIVRERKGAFPLIPPTVRPIDPMISVKFGRSKNPITDFGLRRMIERTLLPFDDPQVAESMTVEYLGVVNLEPANQPVHYLRIERPRTPGLAYTRQDIYIDAETLLPAGTDLYLPGDVLDARYRYADVDPNVTLTEEHFRLSEKHPQS